MILLLAGTKEGRELASSLVNAGIKVLASAATPYGGALLREIPGVVVKTGRLDAAGLERLLDKHRIKGIVDATHPFAEEITRLARQAAQSGGRPYLRWERPRTPLPESDLLYRVEDWNAVAEMISELQVRRLFLTIGINHLEFIAKHPLLAHCSFTARVAPLPGAVSACLQAGLKPQQIIALQYPGSRELNIALLKHFQAEALVTKESGSQGGVMEKVGAALNLEIPVVLVERPPGDAAISAVSDPEAVISWAKIVAGM